MDEQMRDALGPRADSPPVWVLVVDDEVAIAESLALVVEEAGYQPLVANNGEAALVLARAHWPALVLTDLMMPRLSGAGLIAALRAEAAQTGRPMPPVILLTAGGRHRAQAAGADLVLEKPFDIELLFQLLRDFLARES